MVDIIAPRRNEAITSQEGMPTRRFFEYLEQTSQLVNETIPETEINASSVNLTAGQIASLAERIEQIEITLGIQSVNIAESDKINSLELISDINVTAKIAELQNQIDQLKLLVN